MPKVSVIIPSFNAMKYLPRTMKSVLSQSFNDAEIIVVNDGSTDDTERWVLSIDDPRIKIITQENKGLAGARNTGILNSQGEFIAFLDADDIWEPTKLEKQVKALEEDMSVSLVYTWVAYIDEQDNPTGRVIRNVAEGDVWADLTQRNIVESGSVAMVRKNCFDEVGLFDQSLGSYVEDWDMWLRMSTKYRFKVLKEPLVYYRQVSSSASRNWEAMERSFRIVIDKAFNSVSPEQMHLRKQSYSRSSLVLSWKSLQSRNQDLEKAISFYMRAISYYPQICFSGEFFRLSLALFINKLFGASGYNSFLSVFYKFRNQMSGSPKSEVFINR